MYSAAYTTSYESVAAENTLKYKTKKEIGKNTTQANKQTEKHKTKQSKPKRSRNYMAVIFRIC